MNILPAGAVPHQTGARLFVLLQQSRWARQHSGFPHRRGARSEREKCQVQQLFYSFTHFRSICSLRPLPHFSLSFRPKSGSATVSLEQTACEDAKKIGQENNQPTPPHSLLPKPAPRTNPPPARVRTQAYLPPELPPCGDSCMSVSAVSDDGVIHVMTLQAGTRKNKFNATHTHTFFFLRL